MIRNLIESLLRTALDAASAQGTLPDLQLDEIPVERSRIPDCDYTSTLPLRLARAVGSPPRKIADSISAALPDDPMIASVSVAGPGFINFVLSPSWVTAQTGAIIAAGETYGNSQSGVDRRILVEFVSVNPTGPLTVGHGRSAVLGDVLARLLESTGATVIREYYVNDAGNQVHLLGRSLQHHYRSLAGLPSSFPSAGYRGEYVADWAAAIRDQHPGLHDLDESAQVEQFTKLGIARALAEIQSHLGLLDIEFDRWYSENELHASGALADTIGALCERGRVDHREGAVWFRQGAVESDDVVLVKRTGEPTYLAADIAYHRDKLAERNFDLAIDVMGADHHGHAARMHAALEALEIDSERLVFVLCQIVHVVVDGQPVRQSKRAGDFELLEQLVADVGADAVRYFMASRDANSQMEFDIDLARRQSDENPVHKIRYAHARIASILRRAAGSDRHPDASLSALLEQPEEIAIAKRLLQFPELLEMAAQNLEPHRIAHFALALAGEFNSLYHRHRVIGSDPELSQARLALARSVQITLARCLSLLGIAAPQQMSRD